MILVDTSAWVEFLRGRDPLADAVDAALSNDDVALCGPVEAELRRGLRNERERTKVLPLLDACHRLTQPAGLWEDVGDVGFALRRRSVTAKTFDLLIATYALSHSVPLLTADGDFALMQREGVPLRLA